MKTKAQARMNRTVARETIQILHAMRAIRIATAADQAEHRDASERRTVHAWQLQFALGRVGAAIQRIERRAPGFRPLSFMEISRKLREDEGLRRHLKTLFERALGPQASRTFDNVVGVLPHGLSASHGIQSWSDLGRTFIEWSRHLEGTMAHRPDSHTLSDDGGFPGPIQLCPGDALPNDRRCKTLEGDAATAGLLVIGVAAAITVGGIFYGIGALMESLFNGEDDDRAREEIAGLSCSDIVARSDQHWRAKFFDMIDGPTADGDENAMLKVLQCLPDERVRGLVKHFGGLEEFISEFQGDEYDRLALRMQEVGLMDFSDWDDEQAGRFALTANPSHLASMPIRDIVTLCRVLFDGSCGDDDEDAVIRLIRTQSNKKIAEILTQHIHMDEFDDAVDGEQWDILSGILSHARMAVNHS
jgi:hypothetical protein